MKQQFSFLFLLFLSVHLLFAQEEPIKVYSMVNDLRIRKSPDMKGEVIGKMAFRDSAVSLSFSEHTTTATIKGKEMTDYWVEIETMQGLKGWVFGGAIVMWNAFPNVPKDAKSKAAITVNDEGYVIKAKNGATKTLTNTYPMGTMGDEGMEVYHFDAYFPALKYFGFVKSIYESGGYSLVNEDDGSVVEVAGKPVVAPSSKQFICLSNAGGISILTLYQMEGKNIKQEWDTEAIMESESIFFEKVEWVNEKEVKLIGNKYAEDGTAIPVAAVFSLVTKKMKF
ncbi:MAG: SH3 domain-containing protein [Bacteroidales bacterium]